MGMDQPKSISYGHTWLVCGGRDFSDEQIVNDVMSSLIERYGCPEHIVHGGAKGADALGAKWADRMALRVTAVHADWKTHGKAAGPIRNQQMLDNHTPQLVVAFPGGRGTADMVDRAKKADLVVVEVKQTEL